MLGNKDTTIGCYNIYNKTFMERMASYAKVDVTRADILRSNGFQTDNFDYRMKDDSEKKKLNLYFWN